MDYDHPMKEKILDYVLRNLDSSKGELKNIARISGVPYSTVSKIAQRVTPNPGVIAVQSLYDYFKSSKAA